MSEPVLSNHAKSRLIERQISTHDAKKIAKNGEIIESEENGTLIRKGKAYNDRVLIVITVPDGRKVIIKTAYYED